MSLSSLSIIDIGDKIEKMSEDELIDVIDQYYDKWVIKPQKNVFDYLKIALENFGVEDPNGLLIGKFEEIKYLVVQNLSYIKIRYSLIEFEDTSEQTVYTHKLNSIFRAVVNAESAIKYSLYLQNSMTETDIGDDNQDPLELFKYSPPDTSTNNAKQNLMLFLLESLYRNGYRRYDGKCYKKVYTKDGYDTHSWKLAFDLDDYIYHIVDKNIYYEMWQNLTSEKGMVNWATEYLRCHRGPEFQSIYKDRNVFSFNNGILFVKKWSDNINPNITASQYTLDFDMSLLPDETNPNYRYNDPYNIILDKCPHFVSIMNYQEWTEDVQRWLLCLLGRLCFNTGDIDDWQVLPFLLGQAGSGKSTILEKIAKLFYESDDVGTISNNMEVKFGLGSIKDKLLAVGPEIKANFSMEQSEFQSMISGESVQIAIKHKTASSIRWKTPAIIAGNEVPQYSDNAGSISRRLIVFLFNKKVKAGKGDTQLGKKLEKEVGHILYAAARTYLDTVNKHGSSDIWSILPKYFRDSRDEMAATTNALHSFITSDRVILRDDVYCKESVFIDVFNNYCKEKNYPKAKWTQQYCMGPFDTFGLSSSRNRLHYPRNDRGISTTSVFIYGIDLNLENEALSNYIDKDIVDVDELLEQQKVSPGNKQSPNNSSDTKESRELKTRDTKEQKTKLKKDFVTKQITNSKGFIEHVLDRS